MLGRLAGALPFRAALAITQQHEYQHIRPRQFEEVTNNAGWLAIVQALGYDLDGKLASAEQFVATFGGFHCAPLAQFDLVPEGADELIKLRQQTVKQL